MRGALKTSMSRLFNRNLAEWYAHPVTNPLLLTNTHSNPRDRYDKAPSSETGKPELIPADGGGEVDAGEVDEDPWLDSLDDEADFSPQYCAQQQAWETFANGGWWARADGPVFR